MSEEIVKLYIVNVFRGMNEEELSHGEKAQEIFICKFVLNFFITVKEQSAHLLMLTEERVPSKKKIKYNSIVLLL